MSGLERQSASYLGGVSGIRPRVPLEVEELEARAKRAMSSEAFAYIKAGAAISRRPSFPSCAERA